MAGLPEQGPARQQRPGNALPDGEPWRGRRNDQSQADGTSWLDQFLRLIEWLRYLLGLGVMRASRRPSYRASSGEPIYARARLESAKIEESYFYEQEISQNRDVQQAGDPTGKIEFTLPYDGDKYFSSQAYADVTRAYGRRDDETNVVVGRLVLADYGQTNLGSLPGLIGTYGSFPIAIPVRAAPEPRRLRYLTADRSTCVISQQYAPSTSHFTLVPIGVDIDLLDPDSSGLGTRVGAASADDRAGITQPVSFRSHLQLAMTVRLHASGRAMDGASARVAQVRLDWPTITSLRSLSLKVDGQDHPISYNPDSRCLEWSDVPMVLSAEPVGDLYTYSSLRMELSIPQPGELYNQPNLNGVAMVKIDRLLSGTQARLYGAAGFPAARPNVELASQVSATFRLILDDAFARRRFWPYQHIYFDEVILTEMRIRDLVSVLEMRGFEVGKTIKIPETEDWWLRAERPEGPDTMRLELYVHGPRYEARRAWQIPGGVTYQSTLESGEIVIYVRGQLPRTSEPVTYEINALRRALRERFKRLPARR
jgi:hypothetical protein